MKTEPRLSHANTARSGTRYLRADASASNIYVVGHQTIVCVGTIECVGHQTVGLVGISKCVGQQTVRLESVGTSAHEFIVGVGFAGSRHSNIGNHLYSQNLR